MNLNKLLIEQISLIFANFYKQAKKDNALDLRIIQ
jgi:hypothetical protein